MSIVITERDCEVLRFLNNFKLARSSILRQLIFLKGGEKVRITERRLKKLFNCNVIEREKCFNTGEYVYWLSLKGMYYLKSKEIKTYKLFHELSWGTWGHDDFVQTVIIEFRKNGIDRFLSERQLLSNSKLDLNIVPDLGVVIKDNYIIAVEVEKIRKTKERICHKLRKLNDIKIFEIVLYIAFDQNIADNIKLSYDCLFDPSFHLVVADKNIFLNDLGRIISVIVRLAEKDLNKNIFNLRGEYE